MTQVLPAFIGHGNNLPSGRPYAVLPTSWYKNSSIKTKPNS